MDFSIALDKDNHHFVSDGKKVQSRVIHIPVGYVALISLYNMLNIARLKGGGIVNESCLTVKKLSFSRTPNIFVENLCDKTINLAAEADKLLQNRTVLSEPVYQACCEWVIDPANNFALIPVPGFYVLETSELDQLDAMYIEYAVFPATQATAIPDGFKLGN